MLMIIAAGVAGYEWFKLMPRKSKNVIKPFAWGYGLVTAVLSALALQYSDFALPLWIASIFTWILSVYWVKSYPDYDSWYNNSLKFIGLILVSTDRYGDICCLAKLPVVADVPVSAGLGRRQRCIFCRA